MRKSVNSGVKLVLAATMAVALAGCNKAATGQVVAVVNGDEITLPELNAELAAAQQQGQLPAGADKDAARAAALQRIVDRRLITQAAKADGLDRDPDYLIRQRQMNDGLLVELYAKKAQDTIRVPDATAVDKFIADNPSLFGQRTVFSVDQIRLPAQDQAFLDALKPLHTMDEIVALMKSRGITYDRRPAKIDSAQVDPRTLAQVQGLPAGEPFVVATPGGIIISVVTGKESTQLTPDQAKPVAAQMARNQNLGNLLNTRLKDAKAKAKIEYQPGYGPAAAKPGAAATPKS